MPPPSSRSTPRSASVPSPCTLRSPRAERRLTPFISFGERIDDGAVGAEVSHALRGVEQPTGAVADGRNIETGAIAGGREQTAAALDERAVVEIDFDETRVARGGPGLHQPDSLQARLGGEEHVARQWKPKLLDRGSVAVENAEGEARVGPQAGEDAPVGEERRKLATAFTGPGLEGRDLGDHGS